MNESRLWMLADALLARSKDKSFSPFERLVWRETHKELTEVLGERVMPKVPDA